MIDLPPPGGRSAGAGSSCRRPPGVAPVGLLAAHVAGGSCASAELLMRRRHGIDGSPDVPTVGRFVRSPGQPPPTPEAAMTVTTDHPNVGTVLCDDRRRLQPGPRRPRQDLHRRPRVPPPRPAPHGRRPRRPRRVPQRARLDLRDDQRPDRARHEDLPRRRTAGPPSSSTPRSATTRARPPSRGTPSSTGSRATASPRCGCTSGSCPTSPKPTSADRRPSERD